MSDWRRSGNPAEWSEAWEHDREEEFRFRYPLGRHVRHEKRGTGIVTGRECSLGVYEALVEFDDGSTAHIDVDRYQLDPIDPVVPPSPLPVDLYRFYDHNDRLLYVGISLNAARRASEHRKEQSWWGDVARMNVQQLGDATRQEALALERQAILAERPIHNIVHNSRPQSTIELQPWRCDLCIQQLVVGERQGFVQIDNQNRWICYCRDCDTSSEARIRYWIDSSRIATPAEVLNWTGHLLGKRWFVPNEWADMLNRTCLIRSAQWQALTITRHPERFEHPLVLR